MRVYLTPMIGTGARDNPNRGKYVHIENFKGFKHEGLVKSRSGILTYDPSRCCLMGVNTTTQEHQALLMQKDVYVFPVELDREIPFTSTFEYALNHFAIPHAWLRKGMRYREALHRMSGMFQLMQNMSGQRKTWKHVDQAFGMDTRAQHYKHREHLGTVRQMMEKMGDEFQSTTFYIKEPV